MNRQVPNPDEPRPGEAPETQTKENDRGIDWETIYDIIHKDWVRKQLQAVLDETAGIGKYDQYLDREWTP